MLKPAARNEWDPGDKWRDEAVEYLSPRGVGPQEVEEGDADYELDRSGGSRLVAFCRIVGLVRTDHVRVLGEVLAQFGKSTSLDDPVVVAWNRFVESNRGRMSVRLGVCPQCGGSGKQYEVLPSSTACGTCGGSGYQREQVMLGLWSEALQGGLAYGMDRVTVRGTFGEDLTQSNTAALEEVYVKQKRGFLATRLRRMLIVGAVVVLGVLWFAAYGPRIGFPSLDFSGPSKPWTVDNPHPATQLSVFGGWVVIPEWVDGTKVYIDEAGVPMTVPGGAVVVFTPTGLDFADPSMVPAGVETVSVAPGSVGPSPSGDPAAVVPLDGQVGPPVSGPAPVGGP